VLRRRRCRRRRGEYLSLDLTLSGGDELGPNSHVVLLQGIAAIAVEAELVTKGEASGAAELHADGDLKLPRAPPADREARLAGGILFAFAHTEVPWTEGAVGEEDLADQALGLEAVSAHPFDGR
jgi:hypothetical protein